MSDSKEQVKNKGGRPRKFPGEARTAHTFRLREKNRIRLMQDAEANGRSVSEEIEGRIEEALEVDVRIERIFKNRRNYARIAAIMEAMDQAEAIQNPLIKTDDDRECFKTLAAIQALSKYAAFYAHREQDRQLALTSLLAVNDEDGDTFVDRVLMRTDPYFATWHAEPQPANDEDMDGSDVQIRQEPTTPVQIEAPFKRKPRKMDF